MLWSVGKWAVAFLATKGEPRQPPARARNPWAGPNPYWRHRPGPVHPPLSALTTLATPFRGVGAPFGARPSCGSTAGQIPPAKGATSKPFDQPPDSRHPSSALLVSANKIPSAILSPCSATLIEGK